MPGFMSNPYKRKDSPYYWIAPSINGVQVPRSTGETDYDRALTKLRILEGKIAGNATITPKTDRGSIGALLELVRAHYKVNDLANLRVVESRIDLHLMPALGRLQAGKLTKSVINDYVLERKDRGAAIATINRELAILKRGYVLGMEDGEVSGLPVIKFLPGETPQKGFFTEEGFRALLHHANPLLRDVLIFLYYTGWRVESVVTLQWSNVDFARGLVSWGDGTSTKDTPRRFPLSPFPELREMLERRHAEKKALEKSGNKIVSAIFHRKGSPAKSIEMGWRFARRKAGLPGRKLHDFRRTAVRNLEDAGFTETEIMSMVGMATRSIFIRYNITDEGRILRKAEQLAIRQRNTSGSN